MKSLFSPSPLRQNPHANAPDSDAQFLQKAEAMCRTKAAYTTRAEANTFARRRGYPLTSYHCPWCGFWHHTSFDRARARAFTRRLRRLLRADSSDA